MERGRMGRGRKMGRGEGWGGEGRRRDGNGDRDGYRGGWGGLREPPDFFMRFFVAYISAFDPQKVRQDPPTPPV